MAKSLEARQLKNRHRSWKRQGIVGMNTLRYEELFSKQNGLCAVCGNASEEKLHVDHDHVTGEVRALLCRACNLLLGYCHEDVEILQAAIDYLAAF